MNNSIYIRPLRLEDAATSYKWRNNPEIWKFTKFRPDKPVSQQVEADWLSGTLGKKDEKRFAICLQQNDHYIGNVQLLKIKNNSAEFHLFIGDAQFWGKGIGKIASVLILEYAFSELLLNTVYLQVHIENLSALAIYTKMGFIEAKEVGDFVEMYVSKEMFAKQFPINSELINGI